MPSPAVFRRRAARAGRVLDLLALAAALTVLAGFAWLLGDVAAGGATELSWRFLVEEPASAGRAGGIASILASTALVLATCLSLALPLGIGTAAWLSEIARPDDRAARAVRRSLDLLAAVPSIVFGLFGMVFFCEVLGLGFSILAGGFTLATMILPTVVQATYAGLRAVPDELRLAAAALGLPRVTTLSRLLLPAALHGVVVGLLLGVGRALAETAALIFTSGYVTRMPESLLDSGRTLSVHIYDLAFNVAGGESRAHASALVLLTVLLVVNALARWLAARWGAEPVAGPVAEIAGNSR